MTYFRGWIVVLNSTVKHPAFWDGIILNDYIDSYVPEHTTDPREAICFASREDAERFINQPLFVYGFSGATVSQHFDFCSPNHVDNTEADIQEAYHPPLSDAV